MDFLCFTFLKLSKLEMLFQKQDFYIWMKRKSQLGNFYNPNGEKHEIGTFYIEPFISICTRENYSQVFFCWKFTLIPRCYIHVRVQFYSYCFFFNIEIKLKQRIEQNTERNLLYYKHCQRNVWCHLISLFYYSKLRFYNVKLLGTPEKDRQVLGFANPCADSDDEDNGIFEEKASLSGAFNTFVNHCYVKKCI